MKCVYEKPSKDGLRILVERLWPHGVTRARSAVDLWLKDVAPSPALRTEREWAIRSTLVRREGRPENVAGAILFFLENDFVTGVCLPVDGGCTTYAAGS